jgi:hypothetical protein
VGRYIKGIVESMYMDIVSDIRVVVVVAVETPVGMYVMAVTSAMSLRAVSG